MMKVLLFLLATSLVFSESRQEKIQALPIDSYPTATAWHRIGVKDHRGIDLPLLSIVGKNSCGNGEFLDLLPLIDWLGNLGLDILQLLPLNDTAGVRSPYSPISGNALHPIYLSLEALPYLDEASYSLKQGLSKLKKYNTTKRVQFSTVYLSKQKWLKEYTHLFAKRIEDHPDYHVFTLHAQNWLSDYALFKVLINKYGPIISKWPEEIYHPSDKKVEELKGQYQDEMLPYKVIQFLCYHQMHYVHTYANKKGVFLLGDLPFMVSKDSVNVWRHPNYFKLDYDVGTQPGSVVPQGENWGLPPYNWKELEKSHYAFLKSRLDTFTDYYDIFRLDHASGYYWQFEIPAGKPPETGKVVPTNKQEILDNGKRHMEAIASLTDLLPTAEDPRFTQPQRDIIINMGIPGIRMFTYINSAVPIDQLVTTGKNFNLMTITALSDHDEPLFRIWWEENPKRAKAFAQKIGWKYYKQPTYKQQEELLWYQMHSNSLLHIEMLQDILPPNLTHPPAQERINFPGTTGKKDWLYRYKLTVEELISNEELRTLIQTILAPSAP